MSQEKPAPKPEEAPPPAPAPDELAALKAKADEYLDLARRAKADFINYQDRVRREKQEWTRQAAEGLVRELLPALDGLSAARFEDPKLTEAVRLIEREFLRVLAKNGIVPIDTAGKTFDPLYHEAAAVTEDAAKPEGTILEEVRRGWSVEGRVLRPASVRITKAPPPPEAKKA